MCNLRSVRRAWQDLWDLCGRISRKWWREFLANDDGVNFSQSMARICANCWLSHFHRFALCENYRFPSSALLWYCKQQNSSTLLWRPSNCQTHVLSQIILNIVIHSKNHLKQQHLHICLICLCSYQSHSSTSSWLPSTLCRGAGGTRSWSSWSLQPSWLSSQSL